MHALIAVLIDAAGIASVLLVVWQLREHRQAIMLLTGMLPIMILFSPLLARSLEHRSAQEAAAPHIRYAAAHMVVPAGPGGAANQPMVWKAPGRPLVLAPKPAGLSRPAIRAATRLLQHARKAIRTSNMTNNAGMTRMTPDGIPRTSTLTRALLDAAPQQMTALASTTTVIVDVGNVRGSPGTDQVIIGQVHQGDTLQLVDAQGDWFLVRLGSKTAANSAIRGNEGWVSKILLGETAAPLTRVLAQTTPFTWQTSSDARYIFEKDGALHLRVTPEQAGNEQSGRAAQAAVAGLTDQAIREIAFVMTLEQAQGHAPGGSIFHAALGDGRELAMRVGPGEGFPWIDFTLDDQDLNGPGAGFPLRTPTPIRLSWNGSEVTVVAGDEQRIGIPLAQPIESFSFTVDTEKGCIFHITVGDMKVLYAE